MTTTPETPEQIVARALAGCRNPFWDVLEPADLNGAEAAVAALRAVGLLGGDPTEERIEPEQLLDAFEDHYLVPRDDPYFDMRALLAGLEAVAALALTAAGVTPQGPREERCSECGCLNGSHGAVHVRHPQGGGGWNRPCSRAQDESDPSSDSEKLIAEAKFLGESEWRRWWSGRAQRALVACAAALAVPPVDEDALAEELMRHVFNALGQCTCGHATSDYGTGNRIRKHEYLHFTRVMSEWLEKQR